MDVFVCGETSSMSRSAMPVRVVLVRFPLALATTGPNKGVLFAIKLFNPYSSEKEDWKQAFMREVHVLRDCNHPAIVKVFDEGVLGDGRPFSSWNTCQIPYGRP